MKILRISVNGLALFNGPMEVDFLAQQRVSQEDRLEMYAVHPQLFLNNVCAFIGINASGKTSALKAIRIALGLLYGEPINNISASDILSDSSIVEYQIVYMDKNRQLYRLQTSIAKKQNVRGGYYIKDERLERIQLGNKPVKKNLFDFSKSQCIDDRNDKSIAHDYLKEDISIVVAHNKEERETVECYDMMGLTNYNTLLYALDPIDALLEFLDPSIEYLKFDKRDSSGRVRLKFHGKKEIMLRDKGQLEFYLSSGTIKGINAFMLAFTVMTNGGYLLIDELENHFNKEIAATLIKFFMDRRVNRKGGTLVFTTHYSELLDLFDRNDCINIVRNQGGITTENLMHILNRNDIRKSDAYQSSYLGGTAPRYEPYIKLKRIVQKASE